MQHKTPKHPCSQCGHHADYNHPGRNNKNQLLCTRCFDAEIEKMRNTPPPPPPPEPAPMVDLKYISTQPNIPFSQRLENAYAYVAEHRNNIEL